MGNADSTTNIENSVPQTIVEKKRESVDLCSNNKNLELIQYTFCWNEGGNNVLLTGDFVNWNQYFEMIKIKETNYFTLNLTLPKNQFNLNLLLMVNGSVHKNMKLYQITVTI